MWTYCFNAICDVMYKQYIEGRKINQSSQQIEYVMNDSLSTDFILI